MKFKWDPAKAENNVRKYGVSFDEATSIFKDPLALIFEDAEHSQKEKREIVIGMSRAQKKLLRCIVVRFEDTVRFISARPATHGEISHYDENSEITYE